MMLYTRGHKQDYNNWETLGNSGWDWNGLLPYHKKSETYTPQQGPNTPANGTVVYDPKVHGTSGPIQVSPSPFAPVQYNGIYNGAQEVCTTVLSCHHGRLLGLPVLICSARSSHRS